jgi:hypothetical protein
MLFLVTIKLRNGKRLAGVGWFLDQSEAVMQTMADWPEAERVKTHCISVRRSRLIKGGHSHG